MTIQDKKTVIDNMVESKTAEEAKEKDKLKQHLKKKESKIENITTNSLSFLDSNENETETKNLNVDIDVNESEVYKSKKQNKTSTSKFEGATPDDIVITGKKSSLYSTPYVLRKTCLLTENAIRFFRKNTFIRINNCLFNLCMILPIHMSDESYKEVYSNLIELFNNTELQLKDGYKKLLELLKKENITSPKIEYTAPLEMELKIRTPLANRYLKILELLDRMIIAIDQSITTGIIQNPKDAVKLKHRWEQAVYQFSGEIRNLDITTDRKAKAELKLQKTQEENRTN